LDEATAVKQALTLADIETQEIILKALLESFPRVSLAAEEDTDTVPEFPDKSEAQVVIDPIDGTLRSYLEASGPYAVIVGLAVREVYRASLVTLPREGLFFDATLGHGAFAMASGKARRPVRASADGQRVLVSHGMPESVSESLRSQGYEVVSACGGAVAVAPLIKGVCAGVRWSGNPEGISIRGRVGVLISREAGALVRAANGVEFPENIYTPSATLLLCSDPGQAEHLDLALATMSL
jgi:fructose-1,6-bisphosphatase/inositol monophosphatase family enzyme